MGISVSLILIAAGAIVVAMTSAYDAIGWILLAVGGLGILLSLIFWSAWGGFGGAGGRRTTVIEE
jgi:hypothetical protein